MNFIFECSTRYLTSERSSLVRCRVDRSKIKFISTRGHANWTPRDIPYFHPTRWKVASNEIKKKLSQKLIKGNKSAEITIIIWAYGYFTCALIVPGTNINFPAYGPLTSKRNTYIFDQLIESFLCRREDIRILGSEVRCERSHQRRHQRSRLVGQAGKDLGKALQSAKINLPNVSERT